MSGVEVRFLLRDIEPSGRFRQVDRTLPQVPGLGHRVMIREHDRTVTGRVDNVAWEERFEGDFLPVLTLTVIARG